MTFHVDGAILVHDIDGALDAVLVGLQADQNPATAHALGIELGFLGRHAPIDERAYQTAHGGANARAGQPGHQRPGGDDRPQAGNRQSTQAQQDAAQTANDAAGGHARGHVTTQLVGILHRVIPVISRGGHGRRFVGPAVGGHQANVGPVEAGPHQFIDRQLGVSYFFIQSYYCFHRLILLCSANRS